MMTRGWGVLTAGFRPVLLLFIVLAFFLSDAGAGQGAPGQPLSVFVSIPPQKFVVKQIGGDRVKVSVLLPPGKSPATFSPSPVRMAELARARLFFGIGVPFENALLPKIRQAENGLRIVDTRQGISLRRINGEAPGAGLHHGDGGSDPHIWLNPLLVKRQAVTIATVLCEEDPAGCGTYRENCRQLQLKLEELHQQLSRVLAPVRGKTIFVFHPAYGYFTDAYGLTQKAVETEGKAPQGRKLAAFIARAEKQKVEAIFVQPQFDDKAARSIARAMGGEVVILDPLAADYMENLKDMAARIRRALLPPEKADQ